MEPILSIVTGTLDRPDSLKRLLRSIRENTYVPYELLISDAGKLHPVGNCTEPNTKVFREIPRLGHIKGYNNLFRQCSGKWVVWLNDDAVVLPEWSKCVEVMERNSWVGMGILQYGNFGSPYTFNEYQGMPYANFGIIDRELGNRLGWFDDYLYFYGGDNALTFKVFLSGRPVVSIPGEHIIHYPVEDQQRIENVAKQAADATALMNKYRDLLPRMWKVRDEFKRRSLV